jgi:hypothetical protein
LTRIIERVVSGEKVRKKHRTSNIEHSISNKEKKTEERREKREEKNIKQMVRYIAPYKRMTNNQ